MFEAQVERTPDAVAVVFEERQFSYAELNTRANQLAHHLRKIGVKGGALVGIYLERSVEMVVGLLGVLKAGGMYLPLDPTYPAQRLSFMLKDAGIEVLLTEARLLPTLPSGTTGILCVDSEWETIAQRSGRNPAGAVWGDESAYVIYTSGSTGVPKGVQISHRAVVNLLSSMRRHPGLSETDTLLAVTSLSFDIAVLELLLPLVAGARLVIAGSVAVTDGERLQQLLATSGATVMQATPATWRMLIGAGWGGQSGLKILCGGEAMSAELAGQLLKRGETVWNLYGPTETTVWSGVKRVETGDEPPRIGRGVANTQLYVLDCDLSPAPVGVPGEIYIGGAGLADGYLRRPDLTAEKFIPHVFGNEPGTRLYRTGDRARLRSDGSLEFLGRFDRQLKLRGFRIEPGEVEAAINLHGSVRESVVIIRDDVNGNQKLVAYVVAEPSHDEPTHSDLRNILQERLPAFMMPAAFITLDKLPLTPNGKVDFRALPAPGEKDFQRESIPVAPRTIVEEKLAHIWMETLGLEVVGIEDNFFELGGHSLTATRVVSRVRESFDTELTLRQLFASPTVAGLAQQIELGIRTVQGASEPSIAPAARVALRKSVLTP